MHRYFAPCQCTGQKSRSKDLVIVSSPRQRFEFDKMWNFILANVRCENLAGCENIGLANVRCEISFWLMFGVKTWLDVNISVWLILDVDIRKDI